VVSSVVFPRHVSDVCSLSLSLSLYLSLSPHTHTLRFRHTSSPPPLSLPLNVHHLQTSSIIVNIREHTSAYVSIRLNTSAYSCIRQNTSAYIYTTYISIYIYIIYIFSHTHTFTLGGVISLCIFFFQNEALNAVLHLSQLSDQLDVTLESSKIVKLTLTWVATTQIDTIK
jgi:hypothetical protein